MKNLIETTALALAASGLALSAVPASAADFSAPGYHRAQLEDNWDRNKRRYAQNAYAEPVYRNTQVWRGNDGRTYCRKKDGTTGLIIGGAAGALVGREIDKQGSRTVGTILGAAAGALIGKELTDGVRCR